jgi:catechol 1,2-dioxygenase
MSLSRRRFLTASTLSAAGAGLILPAYAEPTEQSGDLGEYAAVLAQEAAPPPQPQPMANPPLPRAWQATEDNILGPYYRPGVPFYAKITPPMEPGNLLVISGRVYGLDTRRPLSYVTLDVWQANAEGRYDNDDPNAPPAAGVFLNRARVMTDQDGYYQYQTIHPGPYRIGANAWRPSHIHYLVRHPGYRHLITQLYFRGDEHQRGDAWIKPSLIIDLAEERTRRGNYKKGTFDIILAPDRR